LKVARVTPAISFATFMRDARSLSALTEGPSRAYNDAAARTPRRLLCALSCTRAGEDTRVRVHDICLLMYAKTPRTWRGVRRVAQYLIASGYECCLDTFEIARREGLEDATWKREIERQRKLVRCLARNLAVIT